MSKYLRPWEDYRDYKPTMLGVMHMQPRIDRNRDAGVMIKCACGCGQEFKQFRSGVHNKIYFDDKCKKRASNKRRREADAAAGKGRPVVGTSRAKRKSAQEASGHLANVMMGWGL